MRRLRSNGTGFIPVVGDIADLVLGIVLVICEAQRAEYVQSPMLHRDFQKTNNVLTRYLHDFPAFQRGLP